MSDMVKTPQFSTGLGLIFFGMKNESNRRFNENGNGFFGRLTGRMRDWFGSAF
jgi:hypothetical protein